MWGITKAVLVVVGLTLSIPAFSLASGISPTSGDIAVMQGEEAEHQITIYNNKEELIGYTVSLVGVDLGTSKEDLAFFELSEQTTGWLSLGEESFVLAPGEARPIVLAATPSETIESGVTVVGIQVLEDSYEEPGVQIGSGFISLVFVTVGDDISEGYELLEFSVSDTLVSQLPVTFFLTIRNNEERVVKPNGSLIIKNTFGEAVASLDVNPEEGRIPEGQTRTFAVEWRAGESKLPAAGVYTIELRATPWTLGEEFTEELTVTVIPVRTIVLLSLFLGLLIIILKYTKTVKKRL